MTSLGKYELHEKIGQGGFSTVYRATHKLLETEVAVKVLNQERLHDPIARERMLLEAKTAASLKHPHIVAIFDLIQEDETLAIAMQYLPAGNLRKWLEQNQPNLNEKLSILDQLAEALDYIHSQKQPSERPLLHRDIKPENVLMDSNPVTAMPIARISDFGLVFDPQEASHLTQAQGIPGTAYYISPELVEGLSRNALDGRSDQYSLAVMAYELLCGVHPFTGNDPIAIMGKRLETEPEQPSQVNPDLPVEFNEPLLKALDKIPENRYLTCADFTRKLAEAYQASRLRQVRELIDGAHQSAKNGDFKTARAQLKQAGELEPSDVRISDASQVITAQAEQAQRYAEAVQNWQTARQKANAVLDLIPGFPDPQGILVTLDVRQPEKPPFNLRNWLLQLSVGILLAIPFVLLFFYFAVRWIINR